MAQTRATAKQVTFKGDGTGAVVRNIHDKLGDTVSVKDFGAVGDGVTDDTAAIQAAIDYGSSLNKAVLVEDTHKLNSNLVAKSNTGLVSSTGKGKFILAASVTAVDQTAALDNFVVDNITFDGQTLNDTQAFGLEFGSTTNVEVNNCTFLNLSNGAEASPSAGYAVILKDATTFKILNNYVSGGYRSITVINSKEGIISKNIIEDIGLDSPDRGVGQIGILIWGNSAETGDGISRDVIVSDNVVKNIIDNGIRITSQKYNDVEVPANTGLVERVTVTGNIVDGTGVDCFRLAGDYITCIGNTAKNPTNSCYRTNGAKYLVIANNVADSRTNTFPAISTDVNYGVHVSLSFDNSVAQSVIISNNIITGALFKAGINISGNTSPLREAIDLNISNNIINGVGTLHTTAGQSLSLFRAKQGIVTGNRITSSESGIYLSNTDNIVVTDNMIRDCGTGTVGIEETSSTDIFIRDNALRNNPTNYTIGTVNEVQIKGELNGEASVTEAGTITLPVGADNVLLNAGANDLQTINGTYIGHRVILRTVAAVTVRDTSFSGGNIHLDGATNFFMNANDTLQLMYVGSNTWLEVSRSLCS